MSLDTLYWEITDRCNLSCAHCYQGEKIGNKLKELSLSESLRRIDLFSAKGIEVLLLTGGEALLNRHIYSIIERSKENGIDTALLSNGSLITEKVADKISKANPNSVQISLDGNRETHDLIRGEGIFSKVDKAINFLQERDVHTFIKLTINKLNYKEIPDVISYCQDKNILLNFSLSQEIGNASEGKIAITPQQYFELFKFLYKERIEKGYSINLPDFAIEESISGKPVRTGCSAGRRIGVITIDDYFLPCPFLAGLGLTPIDGVNKFEDNVFDEYKNLPLFNVIRRLNANTHDCPLRKLQNGESDKYSVNEFLKYENEIIQ